MACLHCRNPVTVWADNKWFYGKQLALCAECKRFHFEGIPRPKSSYFKCKVCNEDFLKNYEKPWADMCYKCWKKIKGFGQVPLIVIKEKLDEEDKIKYLKASVLHECRKRLNISVDTINEVMDHINYLYRITLYPEEIKTFEMYPVDFEGNMIRSKICITPQYPSEFKYHNTRFKILTETRAEIDVLELEKAQLIITEIISSLIYKGYSFSVFYAEGQRSPHVIVYDLEELRDLDPFMREQVQKHFWMDVAPEYWKYLDKAVWEDSHYVPLEYALHWKYGTQFKCLFNYPCKN